VATATTKNAKKYYLAKDCISESSSYAKSVNELKAIETSTKKALADIDIQIAAQTTASATAVAQIETLTQQNAGLELQITEQNNLIVVAETQATDLSAKLANVSKEVDNFTLILNKSKADLAALKADTVNLTKNAAAIMSLTTAISKLGTAIMSIKTSRASSNMQLQSVKSSINNYKTSILKLKSTISKNEDTIGTSKNISATIESLGLTKVKTADQLKQAKVSLAQNDNSRKLLCRAGL
jgi:chromosome segregation ATPase